MIFAQTHKKVATPPLRHPNIILLKYMEKQNQVVVDKDESEEEIDGICFVCGLEGKFVGKKGEDWMCSKHCEIKDKSN